MITKERINPFIVTPPNQCPVCGAELILVTTEYLIHTLHSDGRPGDIIVGNYNQLIRCPACKMKYYAEECHLDGTYSPVFMTQKRNLKDHTSDVKDDFVRNH